MHQKRLTRVLKPTPRHQTLLLLWYKCARVGVADLLVAAIKRLIGDELRLVLGHRVVGPLARSRPLNTYAGSMQACTGGSCPESQCPGDLDAVSLIFPTSTVYSKCLAHPL